MNPFNIIIGIVRILFSFVSIFLYISVYLIGSKLFFKNTPEASFKLRRRWVSFISVIYGLKVKVKGKPIDTAALYVCNHRSLSDPLVLAKFLDVYVIAKAEVNSIPLLGKGAELTGVMYVQRESKDSRSAIRKKMIEVLKSGYNVLVFPEGTTTPEITTREYRPGTFIEAVKNNIPVVPISIEYHNKNDYWYNRGMYKHFFMQFGKPFTKVKVEVGPAFNETDGIELRDKVQAWTNDSIKDLHKGWGSYLDKHDSIEA